jgi:5-methylcytosine-specific restriction endonuclease McrA
MKLCIICNKEKDGSHNSYCKSCNSKRVVEWKKKNRDKYNEYSRQLSKSLSERDYVAYRESRNRSNRSWVEKNKEKVFGYSSKWRKNNPEKYREYDRKRRALKRENLYEPYNENQVLERYGSSCHICNKKIDLSAKRSAGAFGWHNSLHIDHVVPISKGGEDTLNNVRPSHAICNLKKSSRML